MNIKKNILITLFFITLSACTIIEDGQVGVEKSFGKIYDTPINKGIVFQIPIIRTVTPWNIKLQEIQEHAQVPSSEGLIVGLDTSLLFRISGEYAPMIRKTIGQNYQDILINPYLRNSLRDVVAGFEVKQIYSEIGRKKIAEQVLNYLKKHLTPRGVIIEDVLLRDVQLPLGFKESIEAKLAAEQKAEKKKFELDQAKIDAQIEIARAKGAAQAQEIVRSTLSDSYLHYLWIKTLNENPNVIYVATEANMPLFKNVDKNKKY